jgi:uncharacterized protein
MQLIHLKRQTMPEMNSTEPLKKKIYFSYAWGDDNEQGPSRDEIVDKLYDELKSDGYPVVRDKENLSYRESINQFMNKIGEGDQIIVVISEKYLKSSFCMNELYLIAQNCKLNKSLFAKKILPIIIEFVDFNKPDIIDKYFEYWENEYNKWEQLAKKRLNQMGPGQLEKYHAIKLINQNFGILSDWLIDMNTLNPKILSDNNFAEIKRVLTKTDNQTEALPVAHNTDIVNPFTKREMIRTVDEFVGRKSEIDSIITRLQNGSSSSIVGERRIGKSSLLYHIFLTGKERLKHYTLYNYQFVYVDMQKPRMKTVQHFIIHVLNNLGIKVNENALSEEPMVEFEDRLEENRKKGNLPVLLIDEFERITQKPELFTNDFFEELRSFANSGYIAYITASKITLREITENGDLTSSFYNIIPVIELNGFKINGKQNELAEFVELYWKPVQPNPQEIDFLNRYANPHPIKMQVLSFWLLQNRKLQYTEKQLIDEIEKELQSILNHNSDSSIHPTNIAKLW